MLGFIGNKEAKILKHFVGLIESICLQKCLKDMYCFLAGRFRIKIYKYSEEKNVLVLIHATVPWHLGIDEVALYSENEILYKAFFLNKVIEYNDVVYIPCVAKERIVFSFYDLGEFTGYVELLRMELIRSLLSLSDGDINSNIDKTTGLYCPWYFEQSLTREIAKFLRKGGPLGVVMLHMQNLKEINNTHSHETGDKVLQQISANLKSLFRASDIYAHYKNGRLCVLVSEALEIAAGRVKESLGRSKIASPSGAELEILCNVSYISLQELVKKGVGKEDVCATSLSRINRFLAVFTNMPHSESVVTPSEVFVYGHWE